jgi:hypothetical protein
MNTRKFDAPSVFSLNLKMLMAINPIVETLTRISSHYKSSSLECPLDQEIIFCSKIATRMAKITNPHKIITAHC